MGNFRSFFLKKKKIKTTLSVKHQIFEMLVLSLGLKLTENKKMSYSSCNLKLVSAIFYQIFITHQMIAFQKR